MFNSERVNRANRALDFVQIRDYQGLGMALAAYYLDSISYRKDNRERVHCLISHTELSDRAGPRP
jgi:hypothetical protein